MKWYDWALPIVLALIGSGGLWSFIQNKTMSHKAMKEAMLGITHDRIIHLTLGYLEKGYLTVDEFENLDVFLFKPYKKLGGNGTIDKLMFEVKKLPLTPLGGEK